MLLPLFMFLFWFVLWVAAYFLIRKKSSSTIISFGGSFITSIILWIGFMFMLIPFIGERKQNYNDGYKTATVYSANKVEKEKNNTEGLELQIKLVDAVKNLPCTQGGTVEDCFIKKTAIPAVKDLGWSISEVENWYLVERTIQLND